jgi:hypothetical protein
MKGKGRVALPFMKGKGRVALPFPYPSRNVWDSILDVCDYVYVVREFVLATGGLLVLFGLLNGGLRKRGLKEKFVITKLRFSEE